jgi:predicted FMN-binding regulatory protein PaiB/catechol 2,3-dioxygenase-like lactoylglutathione lyase family enzyme
LYIPNNFKEQDGTFIERVISKYDFATLVVAKNDAIEINHIPLVFYPKEGKNGVLRGHVARSNPVVQMFDDFATATAIFNGPHCYISPRWYESTEGHVPTWNYVVVHAEGKIEKINDPSCLKQLLTDMALKFEKGDSAWKADFSDNQIEGLLNGIVGFEIKISELKAKSKLSQNRSENDYNALLKNIKQSDDEETRKIAALMESRDSILDLGKPTGKLHHVEIYVSNLDRSRTFWSWFLKDLGYSIYQEWGQGFSMKLQDTYIVFVQTEEKYLETPYHRCNTGLNHLAFHGRSREHIDQITNKLKEKGLNILYQDKHTFAGGEGNYAVFFEDPDRIKVEVVASGNPL